MLFCAGCGDQLDLDDAEIIETDSGLRFYLHFECVDSFIKEHESDEG